MITSSILISIFLRLRLALRLFFRLLDGGMRFESILVSSGSPAILRGRLLVLFCCVPAVLRVFTTLSFLSSMRTSYTEPL